MAEVSQFDLIDYLVIEANSDCNLACVSCNRKEIAATGGRERKRLTVAELEKILAPFLNCPIRTIKFEWLSEPMLHPEFDVLCAVVRARFPDAHIIIATNLQYEPVRTAFSRTLANVDTVYLSIDGTGAIYEKLRAGARYSRLLASLSVIADSVPAEVRATKLHVNFTLCSENIDELPAVYDLREKFGLASVRINFAQDWNEHGHGAVDYTEEDLRKLRTFARDFKGVPGWKYEDCFWPFHGITVDVAGNVRQCIINTSQQPIGNVFRDDVRALYDSSPTYLEARARLNRGEAPPQCANCDYHHLAPLLRRLFAEADVVPPTAHPKQVSP